MSVYGMTLAEIQELTVTQFLLYSVELVDIMKQMAGGGDSDSGSNVSFGEKF